MRDLAAVGGAVLVAITTALPWGASGRVERSGYALARVVDELGLGGGGTRPALTAVMTLPLGAAAACAALALGRRGAAVVLAGLAGVVGILGTAGVFASSLRPLPGVWAAGVFGSLTVAVAVVALAARRSRSTA